MRWRDIAAGAGRHRRRRLLVVLVIGIGGAVWPETGAIRASSFGDVTTEPLGRGRMVLDARDAALHEQAERAARAARARGLTLYRVLRFAALERRGAVGATGDAGRLGGRTVALGTAVLERDLVEARSLRAEWQRVRAMRVALGDAALPGTPGGAPGVAPEGAGPVSAPPQVIAAVAPALARPVAGAITAPYGVARDQPTGAWFFRTAVAFAARPAELVRSPVGGRVVRVEHALSGGEAVVLEADAHGWTVIVSGLAVVSVTPGQSVRGAEPLGRAEAQRRSAVRLETWRARTPVDPVALLGRH